jgi:hypothetical protein
MSYPRQGICGVIFRPFLVFDLELQSHEPRHGFAL